MVAPPDFKSVVISRNKLSARFSVPLYKLRPNLKRCFLASLTNSLAVTLAANSLMIHFVFGPELVPLIAARSAETLIMLALQTVIMTAIASSDTLYNKIIAFGR